MDRATELLSQLHFDYSRARHTSRQQESGQAETAAASFPSLSLEQRYEQWKGFWQSIDTATVRSGHDSDAAGISDDTERLLRWLAFSRQQTHASKQTDSRQHPSAANDAQSASDEPEPSVTTSTARSTSPHSPAYYVNLARFLSTAPSHRQRLRPQQDVHTAHTKPARPQQRQANERAQPDGDGGGRSKEEEQKASVVDANERVEIVIDHSDDQHVAHRYIHRAVHTTAQPSTVTGPPPPPTCQAAAASASALPSSFSTSSSPPPPSRPSSAYSFTNLPREHIRPALSAVPKTAAPTASFSLHSYFARMSVPQLQRYLAVFNPSLLSSSLALTKDQLISICCTFYRTRIAAHRPQPANQRDEQVKQDAAKDAIVAHTTRTYAHLSLPALLHTIMAATTLATAPAVLSGVGYVDERSLKSGYRRCMLRVHPDKHTLSGLEEQTRCVELFRLVQDKYAHWQRANGQR